MFGDAHSTCWNHGIDTQPIICILQILESQNAKYGKGI